MEKIRKSLRESTVARWIALALISLTMFFAYFFVDVAAPLQSLLERNPWLVARDLRYARRLGVLFECVCLLFNPFGYHLR